jgi:hypothetical protein
MHKAKTGWQAFIAIAALGFGGASAVAMMGSGCAAIVGADSYKVGAESGGGAGAVAGTGGAAGSNGADASSVGGGTGGAAGRGGMTGSGGASGSGGAGTAGGNGTGGSVAGRDAAADAPPRGEAGPDGARIISGAGDAVCAPACTTAGLSCVRGSVGPSGICTYACSVATDCDVNHDCFAASDGASFPYSCLKLCPNNVCPARMFCLHVTDGDVCIPNDWPVLGLGDECSVDSQCISGMCARKPNGFCSRPCVPSDRCDDPSGNTVNSHGEYSWCVGSAGDAGPFSCVPGCDTLATVCSFYPGTTCRPVNDIDNFAVFVCTP